MKKQVTVLGGLAVLAAINMVPAMADDAPAEAYTPAAVATEEPLLRFPRQLLFSLLLSLRLRFLLQSRTPSVFPHPWADSRSGGCDTGRSGY